MTQTKIKGVTVYPKHPDIAGCKTVTDLKKLEIFAHLPKDEQSEAYEELLKAAKHKEPEATA